MHLLHPDQGKAIVRDDGAALLERRRERDEHLPEDGFAVHGGRLAGAGAGDARVDQQVAKQHLHPPGAIYREADELVGLLAELAAVPLLEHLAIDRDHAQRLLEVVARDVRELLQVLV